MDRELKDRIAIVTAAGRGIGRRIALRLTQEEANVVIADLNFASAESVVAFLSSYEADYMTGQAINVTGGEEMR